MSHGRFKRSGFCPVTLAVAVGFLSGCAAGPDYSRPAVNVPGEFKEASAWKIAEPRDGERRGEWWTVYADPVLDDLESRAQKGSQTLLAAEAAYRAASASARQAEATLWPTVGVDAGLTRSQQAAGISRSASGSQNVVIAKGPTTLRSAQITASWELDLWGSLRRAAEAGRATAAASLADYEAAKLSIAAELATDYFDLRVADATGALLAATVAGYERSLAITRNQYAAGVAGRVDVAQAEAQLKATEAQAVDVGVQRAQLEHAIATLIGVPPAQFSIEPLADWQPRLPAVPALVAADLLERRPDIAAAERRVAAANAQIGVASAAWYPTLSLSAAGGYESLAASHWFSLPNRFWSVGPALAATLFDAGRRHAVSDQARAGYDQSVANYRQTALQAFQDVEDSLVALRLLHEEIELQRQAAGAARESATLTLNQYRAGTVSFLSVVTVQSTALANERTVLSLVGRELAASVGLIRGLGGGWQPLPQAPPKE